MGTSLYLREHHFPKRLRHCSSGLIFLAKDKELTAKECKRIYPLDYAGSKIAGWYLTQVLAAELQPERISVNELIPGPVKTAIPGHGVTRLPPGEWVKEPEDVVPMAMFPATQPDVGPTAQSFSLMRRA